MCFVRSARTFSALGTLLLFAACGGGSGGSGTDAPVFNPPPQPPTSQQPTAPQQPTTPLPPPVATSGSVSLEKSSVTFATSVRDATPPDQFLDITLNGVPEGTPSYNAQISGDAVDIVDLDFTNGIGRLRIVPQTADRLRVGINTATITISICIGELNCFLGQRVGEPQTISVTYAVTSSVQGDVVGPRVATANQPGEVVMRGRGFTSATSVRFGSVSASAMTVVSDSQIRASHPALAPGRYPVAINSGAIAFTGTLTVVDVPDYGAATLAFPSTPLEIAALLYDPERNSLLVAARYEQPEDDQLIRFTYDVGQWSTPLSIHVPGIRDVAFSPDGRALLIATDQQVVEYDPSTLEAGASATLSEETLNRARSIGFSSPEAATFRSLAVGNDGYAIVSTSTPGPTVSPLYVYSTLDHTFTVLDRRLTQNNANAGASASGSFVALLPSIEGNNAVPALLYDASQQLFLRTGRVWTDPDPGRGLFSARPALDRAGSLSVLNTAVYDNRTLRELGQLPASTAAAVLNPDATRAYTLNTGTSFREAIELRTYDITQLPEDSDDEYPQLGAVVPLSLQRGNGAFVMTSTPDGSTLFLGGVSGVIVQPTPQ